MKTREVSISEFLKIYKANLEAHFKEMDNGGEDFAPYGIYGQDFTVTWNGLTVNLGDGAGAYATIIPALEEFMKHYAEE